jgi:hypothetical protein
MKTLTFLLLIGIVLITGNAKAQRRYFEFGAKFETGTGCKSSTQGTFWCNKKAPSYDDLRKLTQNWVGADKIIKFSVFYFAEISKGQMYVFSEPYHCDGSRTLADTSHKRIKILNSIIK